MKIAWGVLVLAAMVISLVLALPLLIDLNQYQDQYKPVIERALNRTIQVQDIRLALWPAIGVRVTGLSILDDPAFGTKPFVSVASLDVGVRLLPLLTGKVEVEEIMLHNLVMTVVKNRRGVLNVATLGREGKEAPTTPSRAPIPSLEGPVNILGLLAIDRISVVGGRLAYRDFSTVSAPEYGLKDLDLLLCSMGIGHTPHLRLTAVVQPLNVPLNLEGTFGPLKETADIEAINLQVSLGSTHVTVTGKITGHDAALVLHAPTVKMTEFPSVPSFLKPVAMNDCSMAVEVKGQKVELTAFSCRLFGGVVKGRGTVVAGSDAPPFDGMVSLEGLQLGPALRTFTDAQVSISGTADVTLAFNGRGFVMQDLIKSLAGRGRIVVKNGMIGGVDLPGETRALLHAAGISLGVTDPLAFQTLEADGVMGGNSITVQRLLAESPDVQATAAGTIGFDQTLDLTARLSLSPDLSRRLAKISSVASLMMQDGRVILPLVIKGTLQEPLYRLDLKDVAARLQRGIQGGTVGAMGELLMGTMPEPIKRQGRRWLQGLFETIEAVTKSEH
jgi:AsmA protein